MTIASDSAAVRPPFPADAALVRPFLAIEGLNPSTFNMLLDGFHAGLVYEPDVLPAELVARVAVELDEVDQWDLYDQEVVQPPVARLGPAAFSYMAKVGMQSGFYSQELARARRQVAKMLALTEALTRMGQFVSAAVGMPIRAATHRGIELGDFILRDIRNGNGVHFDHANAESLDLIDQRFAGQVSFLVSLTAPASGGECVVYDRRFETGMELGRLNEVVAGAARLVMKPTPGTLYAFSTKNLHEVLPAAGGKRVTASFFAGVSAGSPHLYVWA